MGDHQTHNHEGEILRCINIGLLCVQESANERPTMSEVVYMLSYETSLPPPDQPAFVHKTSNRAPTNSVSTSLGALSVNDATISIVQAR